MALPKRWSAKSVEQAAYGVTLAAGLFGAKGAEVESGGASGEWTMRFVAPDTGEAIDRSEIRVRSLVPLLASDLSVRCVDFVTLAHVMSAFWTVCRVRKVKTD